MYRNFGKIIAKTLEVIQDILIPVFFFFFSMELGFWILIVNGIPDSLNWIPDSKAKDWSTTFVRSIIFDMFSLRRQYKQN